MRTKYRKLSLSVFFPAYNEEDNISDTLSKAIPILDKLVDRWEIIVVDDGSKDKTSKKASVFSEKDSRVRVVRHPMNKGYGGALKTGFAESRYSWIFFTDADGQFDFGQLSEFLPFTKDFDLILGYRLKRADPFLRKVFTWGWSFIAHMLLGLQAKDYSCGFKLIKKTVYEKSLPLVGEEKVTQIELLVKARRMGFRFKELGVKHYPRKSGKQTGANLSVVVKSVLDLFWLWKRLKRK